MSVAEKKIPAAVQTAQMTASNPVGSVWVSAHAGSGKTYVLAQRVIRLLLDGVDPAKILCLTFTKAAAANMSIRVFETLATWTALDDAALDAAIRATEGRLPDAARRRRARRLFAEALETPGGLKVQTIHAFCTALLQQFPFEAGVAARFEVMEDRIQNELIDDIRMDVLLEAARTPGSILGRALSDALVAAGDQTFTEVIREAVRERDAYEAWREAHGGEAGAIAALNAALGVEAADTVESLDAAFLPSPLLPRRDWLTIAEVLDGGKKTDQDHAQRFRRAAVLTDSHAFEPYLDIFFGAKREPRQNVVTKGIRESHPDIAITLDNEQMRLAGLMARRRGVLARDRAAALAIVTFEILKRYRGEKARRGLLDYDDLIEKTRALLGGQGAAAWVMYKLDLGIDHLLIDEAQDTNEAQWDVIRALTAEFFAGAGARSDVKRSIFAVGDEKQSIYSFQGADPQLFDKNRRYFASEHQAGDLPFENVPLSYSFRSTRNVLSAVDTVFAQPKAHAGMSHDPVATVHQAVRDDAPGDVEFWSLVEPLAKAEVKAWNAPFDAQSEESPPARLAQRIAQRIKAMIDSRTTVAQTGKAMTPGDILVLVRQRGPLFEGVIRALKAAKVAVAGADRLVLTEHIAVMDLMSLSDALLLREHDLALAETLKSPLFDFNEEDLYQVAYDRKGVPLRDALEAKRWENQKFAQAIDRLNEWQARARAETPFAFFAHLLGPEGGRKPMIARLGPEASDALDEFLALAMDYESRHAPSLQGFMAWLRAANADVKRDMDIARDEVRVMTVHGAKGLEAPVVILADTCTPPRGYHQPRILRIDDDAPSPILWLGRSADDVPLGTEARARAHRAAEEEHSRLLYVAMTRAADTLIVCGAKGVNEIPGGCWYDLVSKALRPDAAPEEAGDGDGTIWRWRKSEAELRAVPDEAARDSAAEAPPDWLSRRLDGAPTGTPVESGRLTPSGAGAKIPRAAAASMVLARRRGVLIHRLLQSLPELPPDQRANAAADFLSRRAGAFADTARAAMVRQVLAVLEHDDFAPLFAPGTRAEVPIVGHVARRGGKPVPVSGQIDRLAVTADAILIVDFKTDRAPNARTIASYATQLALYRALLTQLYPGRPVRAALVWTETVELLEMTAEMLDSAAENLGIAMA